MEVSLGSSQPSVTKRPLVLAVDDNEDNLVLISFTLDLFGWAFVNAVDGYSALDLAKTYKPDLILLDVMLPDLDGIEVVYRLKQDPHTKEIPVIAVTALASAQDRDRMLAAGCNDYISKPYIVDELEVILRRYLG